MKTTHYLVIGTVAASALAGTLVYASQYGERDRAAIPERVLTPISLSQAIAIAERHAEGPAVGGELEQSDGRPVYEVDVATGGRVIEVKVDAGNGSVIGVKTDHADDGGDGEKRARG